MLTKAAVFILCAVACFGQFISRSGGIGGAGNLTTTGAVPYVSSSGVLNQDADLTFSTASNRFRVNGTISVTGTMATESNIPGLYLGSISSSSMHIQAIQPGVTGLEFRMSGFPVTFYDIGAGSESARFASNTQNFLIGTASDGNFRLDVAKSGSTGTARIYDQTATTGITRFRVQAGAGQSTNALQTWTNVSGTTLFSIAGDGLPQWSSIAEPTCNSSNRGKVTMVQGGAGVADTFRVCRKDNLDAYAWVTLI